MYKMPLNSYSPRTKNIPQLPNTSQKDINEYVIDRGQIIGKGNYSTVYACYHQNKPRDKLAAKVVNINILRAQKIQHLLKSQIDILISLKHPNIITCKDVFIKENQAYIITELCEGGNLETRLANHGIMAEQQSLKIIKNVFDGLSYLQKNHIIHRDIKVANIFLKHDGNAIIADFGFASFINQSFHDLRIGSLPYMTPQSLINNFYTPKNDVWSFGVFIYHLFHGESPYARSFTVQQLCKKVSTPLDIEHLRADLSIAMKELILNCLQINFQKRPTFTQLQQKWYYKHLFCRESISPKKLKPIKFYSLRKQLTKTNQVEKASFKEILEHINYCKNLFKLTFHLSPQQKQRKCIFTNYALSEIKNILNQVENDKVNYGLGNGSNRKKKLKVILTDQLYDFNRQMKKKDIQLLEGTIKEQLIRKQLYNLYNECSLSLKNATMKERIQTKRKLISELLESGKENLTQKKI